METSSLIFRTEEIFWKHHCAVEDVGDARIITTPDNHFWNWGNYLLLKRAPVAQDLQKWLSLIEGKIMLGRQTTYYLIAWEEGEIDDDALHAYTQWGLEHTKGFVLKLETLQKPKYYNDMIEVREIPATDPLWSEIIQLDIDCFSSQVPGINYARYAIWRMAHHQSVVAKGEAKWFGAMVNGGLAGAVGIYPGEGLYRYQEVAVREEYRRQGVASTMIYEVAARASEANPLFEQVIVADSEGEPMRVYQSLGFVLHSISHALGGRKRVAEEPTGSSVS